MKTQLEQIHAVILAAVNVSMQNLSDLSNPKITPDARAWQYYMAIGMAECAVKIAEELELQELGKTVDVDIIHARKLLDDLKEDDLKKGFSA